jgi:hypothetical protein
MQEQNSMYSRLQQYMELLWALNFPEKRPYCPLERETMGQRAFLDTVVIKVTTERKQNDFLILF